MKNGFIVNALCLMLIVMIILQPNIAVSQQGYDGLYVFYIPFGDIDTLLNTTSNKLNTSILNLKLDATLNPDFYLYWLVTGEIPDALNISLLDAQVNQDKILYLWSNATLIDIPLVNPEKHPSAINPVIDISFNHVPPFILEIPVNSSKHVDLLGTDVAVEVTGTTLKVALVKYNKTLTTNFNASRSLGPILVNITEPEKIAGEYYVSFYVESVDSYSNVVKLFFPGSIKSSYYVSPELGEMRAATHWYLVQAYGYLAKSLTQDALNWWIKNTVNTTIQFLTGATYGSQDLIYIAYIPHLTVVNKLLDEQSIKQVQQYLFEQIISFLTNEAGYNKQNYLAIFILVNEEKSYAVFAGKNTNLSGELNVDYTATQIVGALLSYSNALPFNNNMAFLLNIRTRELERTIDQLRTSLDELNTTLTSTKSKLTTCESERELLRIKTADIDAMKKEAEELLNTAKLYIAGGLVIVISVSALLGFLALRVTAKKKSTR